MVQRERLVDKLHVTADGTGQVGHAGSALLAGVMLADGGECLADPGGLRDQLDSFGGVAFDSTAFRVIDSIDEGP